MYPVRRQISPHAARLRREQTDVERTFWLKVRDRRLDGFKFRRQVTVGPYIADFLCVEAKLIVELDGGQHGEEVDAKRTAFLKGRGYRILRFWNNDVAENVDGVLMTVLDALHERSKTLTQPASGEHRPAMFRSCRGHDRPAAPAKAGEG